MLSVMKAAWAVETCHKKIVSHNKSGEALWNIISHNTRHPVRMGLDFSEDL